MWAFNTNRKDCKGRAHFAFTNVSLERKSCLFQRDLYFMCWLWDLCAMIPFQPVPLCFLYWSPVITMDVPCCLCLLPYILSPYGFHLHRRCCLAVCVSHKAAWLRPEQQGPWRWAGLNRVFVRVFLSAAGGIKPAMRAAPPGSKKSTGPRSKTFWKEADGDMNSAAGPLYPRLLPCVQHTLPQTNASHNWCAGMAPSSVDFADWQKHQGHYCSSDILTLLYCRFQEFLKSRGLVETSWREVLHPGLICLPLWIWCGCLFNWQT